MFEDYFVVDIETCPNNLENYNELDEENKLKLLNPIDSKIVAIGIRRNNENKILMGEEKEILKEFWEEWGKIKRENANCVTVGFNINHFDLPFIVSRSFIHNVEIVPFVLKLIIDLREKINAYRYGKTRGKLSDYGKLLNLKVLDMDGSMVSKLCEENNMEKLKEYLINDLEITDEMFKRVRDTNIIHINRW
ncbi:MAG: hypothetical protein CMH64_01025 [Nanoarchaeota archaeon]|nr:hypothetical protein [Nanoarchaeota archaeon]|tara:strand:- start:993 stop:1568 length:576 start_codon:yes stop_codon:yes gene_type:complete